MSRLRARLNAPVLRFGVAALLLAACGGADDGTTGPGPGQNEGVSATATPASATIAPGTTTSVTIVYAARGGVVIGGGGGINKQFTGISVDLASSVVAGSMVTEVYTVGADATVPAGTHSVFFSKPVSGFTRTDTVPSSVRATFALTVRP